MLTASQNFRLGLLSIAAGALLASFAVPLLQGQPVSPAVANRIELTLEQQLGQTWQIVAPETVFHRNDRVRFRLHTNFEGFLYVVNQASSGQDQLLFPSNNTGLGNRVNRDNSYTVPDMDASFRIAGPKGYELVRWVFSPVELPEYGSPTSLPSKRNPNSDPSRVPRCGDPTFRARGECVDRSAGPRGLPDSSEITFIRIGKTLVIESKAPFSTPIVYQFRISHY